MNEEFWAHLKKVLADGETRGMQITYVFPDACSEAQMEGIRRIMAGREACVCAVIAAGDDTFLVYGDPRYPGRLAYLAWTSDGLWETPRGDALRSLMQLETTAFN